MKPRSRVSHHRLAGTDRLARHSEAGAALVIALVMIVVFGVILAGLLTYAGTSVSTDRTYSTIRKQRYAGDSAIRAAINWVRDQPKLARDPALSVNDPACVYHVPSQVGTITTSCAADRNGGSGKPSQGGLVPDQAIVALGERQNESRNQGSNQFNNSGCGSDFINFFSPESPEPSAEPSILLQFNSIRQPNGVSFVCNTRSRPTGEFTVNGNVLAAGRVKATSGFNIRTDTTHTLQAKAGCIGTSPLCSANSGLSVTNPATGNTAWDPVPINWDNVRSNPFWWDGTKLVEYTSGESCSTRGGVIIFQPGWYKDANAINKYTGNSACSDRTIWFAPDAGPDGLLETPDDLTGAYYFGFQNTSASYSCNVAATQSHRLCIGGSATSTPRVVAGGVKTGSLGTGGFEPLAVPGGASAQTVTISQATTVDSGLSQSWSNADGAKLIGDSSGPGVPNIAVYSATFCLPLIGCRSTDRSIRVRNFAPQVATGPDKVGSSPGPIYLQVAHQEDAGSGISPSVEVRAVGPESGRQASCGTFTLPQRTTLTTDTFTAAQATQLGACLPSADLINGMQVTYRATGNGGNDGSPKVRLDGVKATFTTTPTTSFPASVGSSGTAAVDCDPEGAGAQFILGGDSHIYVADGNLQLCAGAYPTNPEDHQQIGIWQAPAVAPIPPTGPPVAEASTSGSSTTLSSAANAVTIAEPTGTAVATLKRSANCDNNGISCGPAWLGRIGGGTNTAIANFDFGGYTPPAGTAIDSIQLRATYTNADLINLGGVIPNGSSARLEVQGCSSLPNMGTTPSNGTTDLRTKAVDVTSCLTDARADGSFVSQGFTVAWRANRTAICGFGSCTGGIDEKIDGIQMLVNLKPLDANSRVIVPASGCTRGLPNYWAGLANPDCAVLKADSTVQNSPIPLLQTDESKWFGRFSVQGTIYAPSGAVEIDDSDAAYPAVTRGMVVRHLRVTGYAKRSGYVGSSVDVVIKKDTAPREATFLACIQSAARVTANAACDATAGDRLLTRARVRFEIDPATASNPAVAPKANVPQTLWWSTKR